MPKTIPGPMVLLREGVCSPEALARYGGGYDTVTEFARACRLSGSTLRRVLSRELLPGPRMIAALMVKTGLPFEKLFEIRTEPLVMPHREE